MRRSKWYFLLFSLLILSALIHYFSQKAFFVENSYSSGIYRHISVFLRILSGWIPFSIGDIIYGSVSVWLLWSVIKLIAKIFKRTIAVSDLKKIASDIVIGILVVYCVFNLLWGINYDRKGIAYQLGLKEEKYSAADLRIIDSLLLQKTNESKLYLMQHETSEKNTQQLFNESQDAYKNLVHQYSFLQYSHASVKSSMWGWLGNYVGFVGYYNPFTGEAQVNTNVPYFLQPYTTCHEMAHQLGYAKEDEANFVGYLAATASSDTLFHYSVYLDLFLTANRSFYFVDSSAAKNFAHQLVPAAKTDLKQWRNFIEDHRTPLEPAIRWLYGKYLENNKQPSGILTYDEVTGLLIEYYKKFGRI